MAETINLNVLGDTEQAMWLNSIDIYGMVVRENVRAVRNHIDDGSDDVLGAEDAMMLDKALETLETFAGEMRRFVQAVYQKEKNAA